MEPGKEGYRRDASVKRYRLQWAVVGLGLIVIVLTQKPSPFYWMILLGVAYALETPNTFTLFTIANLMYVFPKRAFSEQSCEEFRRLIVQKGIRTKPR
jgi:hypothetical protein